MKAVATTALATTALALAFGLSAPAAMGQAALRPEAVLIGPATGDPEKDSIGFLAAGPGEAGGAACGGALRFTSEAVAIGAPMDDPEKDSIGFLLLPGEEGCAGTAGGGPASP